MSKKAMKLALEALQYDADYDTSVTLQKAAIYALENAIAETEKQEPYADVVSHWHYWMAEADKYRFALQNLEEALAKQEQGEPLCTAAMFDDAFLAKSGLSPDTKLYTTPQPVTESHKRKPLMLEKFREMETLLGDNPHPHKNMFTDDELKIIMETTMPVIDWKARYGVELNNGERNKWMLEWFIAFARAIEAAHGIKGKA